MAAKLSKAEAMRAAHEVAAWMAYERDAGAFYDVHYWYERTGVFWHVGRDLGGSCIIASTILAATLGARGVRAGVVNHTVLSHMLVATGCGLLIDPTASQFGYDGPTVRRGGDSGYGASAAMMMRAHLYVTDERYNRHPCWPVNHVAVIARILRRMGAERALRFDNVEAPRGS